MDDKPKLGPIFVAKVVSLAESQNPSASNNSNVERDVLDRIQNCLKRATHPDTPEAESQTALRMSSRLMQRYNVSQADLIAAEIDSQKPGTRGGMSTVRVTKTKPKAKNITLTWIDRITMTLLQELEDDGAAFETLRIAFMDAVEIVRPSEKVKDATFVERFTCHWDCFNRGESLRDYRRLVRTMASHLVESEPSRTVKGQLWLDTLGSAIATFFDCKCYSQQMGSYLSWVFYGISVNTVAAAMAFEMVFNFVENRVLHVRGNKASYRLGVADGLEVIADNEKAEELLRIQKQEEADLAARERAEEEARQKEINRLKSVKSEIEDDPQRNVKVEIEDEVDIKLEFDSEDHFAPLPDGLKHDDQEPNRIPLNSSKIEVEDVSDGYPAVTSNNWFPRGTNSLINCTNDGNEECVPCTVSTPGLEKEIAVGVTTNPNQELGHRMPQNIASTSVNAPTSSVECNTESEFVQRDTEEEPNILWRDPGVLALYRKNATLIAEDYLKEQGLKLVAHRRKTAQVRDYEAYQQGEEDSKQIDVKRRRIQSREDIENGRQ